MFRHCSIIVFAVIIGISAAYAQQADFLLVEQPAALRVLNNYQQQVRQPLPAFAPLRIVTAIDTLSDGFTLAMRVNYHNDTYFLLTGRDGRLIGEEDAGRVYRLGQCTLLSGAIEISDSNRVWFTRQPPWIPGARLEQQNLKSGTRLTRLFRKNGFYFVDRLTDEDRFGWLRTTGNNAYRILLPETDQREPLAIPDHLRQSLLARLQQANDSYTAYFRHFNQQFQKDLVPPRWEISVSPDRIAARWQSPHKEEIFRESTRQLIHDLEGVLLGSNLYLNFTDGEITIQHTDAMP